MKSSCLTAGPRFPQHEVNYIPLNAGRTLSETTQASMSSPGTPLCRVGRTLGPVPHRDMRAEQQRVELLIQSHVWGKDWFHQSEGLTKDY